MAGRDSGAARLPAVAGWSCAGDWVAQHGEVSEPVRPVPVDLGFLSSISPQLAGPSHMAESQTGPMLAEALDALPYNNIKDQEHPAGAMAEPGAPTAAEVVLLRNELREVRRELRRSAKREEYWRALDVITHPVSGLGFFALGLALPMIVAGARAGDLVGTVSNVIPGTIMLLLALSSILLPMQLQGYFLGKPSRISSFFRELERNEGRGPLEVMQQWADAEGDAAKSVRAAIAQARFVARAGVLSIVLMVAAVLTLYYAFMTLLVLRAWGPLVAILFVVALVLGTTGAFLWVRRRNTADRP
jgi:hypothetical protein